MGVLRCEVPAVNSVKQLLRCLVATAILFAVARPVGATCGDWLQHTGSDNQHPGSVSQMVRAGHDSSQVSRQHGTHKILPSGNATNDASASAHESTSSRPTKRPCDGPSCGRAPKAPAAASDSIVTLRRVVDGDLVEALACPDHQYEGYLRDVASPKRLAGFPLSILRPPMA